MNQISTFYTPGTGLPDFEMRIALGLCAAALNSVDPEKITLIEQFDRYEIRISTNSNSSNFLTNGLGWLCQNKLADQSLLLRTPGFRPLHLDKQAEGVASFGNQLLKGLVNLEEIFSDKSGKRMGAHSSACGHAVSKEEKIFGALLAFSPQLGQPPKRDSATYQITLPICPYCGVAALAGTNFFQIDISISSTNRQKKERFFFLPHFKGEIKGELLIQYLSAAKHIRGNLEDIPASSGLLALLALHPHLIMPLEGSVDAFFVSRIDSSGNAPRFGFQVEQAAQTEIRFLKAIYNRSLVQKCYREDDRNKLLGFLSRALQSGESTALIDFAKSYSSATESKALLPWSTTEFFIMEVLKMDKTLLEGDAFKVIKEVADMLQYFVRDRNFGYVDNLRKARDADEFARLLLDAQRDAQSAMLDPKKQYKPFLPGQSTIQKLLKLINENIEQFQAIKTLIALLAFTYFKSQEA